MTQAIATFDLPAPALTRDLGPDLSISRTGTYRFGYVLFVLVVATVFIRPGDIFPQTEGWPFYELLIFGSFLASVPAVLAQLQWVRLYNNAAILCAIGMLPAIIISHLAHGDVWSARMGAFDFIKVLLFFVLLVSLIDTLPRLRLFLWLVSLFIFVTALIAVLCYHEIIHLDAIEVLQRTDSFDPETGEPIFFKQLQACGVFGDPNDFSLVLVTGILATIYFVSEAKGWLKKLAFALPAPLLIYAFALTKSRGGFLSLMAGIGVYLFARLGWKRGLRVGLLIFPLLIAGLAGRQTNINMDDDDTAAGRVKLWREGFQLFKTAPVFGIGYGTYADEAQQVAHNSYVHAYTELGFIGGTVFLSAMLLPILAMGWQKKTMGRHSSPAPEDMRLEPLMLAAIIAYAVGLFSLSRAYSSATYLIMGIASAYCAIRFRPRDNPFMRISWRLLYQMLGASVAMIIIIKIFIILYA